MEAFKIIGVGNLYRRDDGVGIVVARRVAAEAAGAVVVEATGEGAELMDAWQDAAAVVVVDAARSGAVPGTVFRFNAAREALPVHFFNYSTHAFSVAEAVELARALGDLPPHLVLYGIEGADFGAGAGLSPDVARAVDAVVRRILEELAAARLSVHP